MNRIILLILFIIYCGFSYADDKPNCNLDKGDIDASCDCSQSRNALELSFCTAAKRDDSDKKLNELYSTLMNRLTPESQTSLQNAQRAWIKFRDAECLYINGPSPPPEYVATSWNAQQAACMNTLTKRRVEELKSHVACTEGGCPK